MNLVKKDGLSDGVGKMKVTWMKRVWNFTRSTIPARMGLDSRYLKYIRKSKKI